MKPTKKLFFILLTLSISLSLMILLPSCRAAREKAKEREMEKLKEEVTDGCVNFTGKWDTNLGELEILQRGCDAEGTLTGIGGGFYRIEGKVTEDVLDFEWKGPKGNGLGYFKMDESGDSFTGEYGDEEENTGKGVWDGERLD